MEPITAIGYNMLNDCRTISRLKGVRETHALHTRSDREYYIHATLIPGHSCCRSKLARSMLRLNRAKEVQIEKLATEKLIPCDTRDNRNHSSHGLHIHRDPLHRAELSCRRYQHAAGPAKR